jgi:hypothetical protein
VEKERKQVVLNPFLPLYVGEYEGATVLGTSCFVESGFFPLADYLLLLRRVFNKILERGITELYLKFHPAQATYPQNMKAYRKVVEEFSDRLRVTELPQGTSIESLAAGNQITFITGISTLAFHVHATGARVFSYLKEIEEVRPQATLHVATGGMVIFQNITEAL